MIPTVRIARLSSLKAILDRLRSASDSGFSAGISIVWTTNGELILHHSNSHEKLRSDEGLEWVDVVIEGHASFVPDKRFVTRFKNQLCPNHSDLCRTADNLIRDFLRQYIREIN